MSLKHSSPAHGGASSGSVARRITLLAIALLSVVLLVVSLAVADITTRTARSQAVEGVGNGIDAVSASLDAMYQANVGVVRSNAASFGTQFSKVLQWDPASGELRSNGTLLNGSNDLVDGFARMTGGVATVFARKGDDFVRIATSLQDERGARAVGTVLDRSSPAYAKVSQGESYIGRATLFGRPYMANYEPRRDASGQIVGLLFVGVDLTIFREQIQKQISALHFFQHGGGFVIDPRSSPEEAVFIAHPTAIGKKVLQAFPQARDYLQALQDQRFIDPAPALLPVQGAHPWAVRSKTQSGWWVVAEVSDDEALADQRSALWGVWGVIGGALVVMGAGLFLVLRRGISQPLRELTQAVTLVAQGDLTQAFTTQRQDEMGTLIREVEGLRQRYVQMLQQVRTAVDSITNASAEIAMGNQDLSGRTESAAASLAGTAQSMEQFTATVRQSADAARMAHQLATSAGQVAERGGQVVGDVVATMGGIQDSSRKIGDIIGVIDSIAFQTNILALNAAVEAARAGEQGRGFAVVASEVRALAGRSAEAAREIKALIGASVEQAEAGAVRVQAAGSTMEELLGSVRRVGDIVGEISAAAAEQASGIGQVNGSITQLDQMTQQNAALVEESAAAAQSLRDQAARLAQAVEFFRLSAVPQQQQPAASGPLSAPAPAPAARASRPALPK